MADKGRFIRNVFYVIVQNDNIKLLLFFYWNWKFQKVIAFKTTFQGFFSKEKSCLLYSYLCHIHSHNMTTSPRKRL